MRAHPLQAIPLLFLALSAFACPTRTIYYPDGGTGGAGAGTAGSGIGGAGAGGMGGRATGGVGGAGAAGASGGTAGRADIGVGGGGAAGASGGTAGRADGGVDAGPVACATDGTCPSGTVCGPQHVCVGCSAVTSTLPAAPALLRPMRGAYTGSLHAPSARATLRPTFTWSPVAATCGAVTYEVELDDSCLPGALSTCAFPSPEVDARAISATRFSPSQDLKVATTPPVGAFYAWRVRACDASSRCGAWSEVRYVQVGRVREDINGDGYGDLLAMSSRGIEVYLGSSQFDVTTSSHTWPYTGNSRVSFVGDVNGDGFGDMFGSTSYAPTAGYAPTLYLGGVDATSPQTVSLTKTAGGPSTFMQTTSAGDVNGDGFADLIVQWGYSLTTPQTELRVFFGGTSLSNTPDLSIPGPYSQDHTLLHSGRIGDVNGDGFEDIALTAEDGSVGTGVIEIFTGGSQPKATSAASLATAAATYDIRPAGDINGDGFDDAIVVNAGTGYYLYTGAANLPTTLTNTWSDSDTSDGIGGFDIDGDGLPDVVIGSATRSPHLYRGSVGGLALVSGGLANLTESALVGFSDHDGDGRPDIIGAAGTTGNTPIEWAGSDGTTNPRVSHLQLSGTASLTGIFAR